MKTRFALMGAGVLAGLLAACGGGGGGGGGNPVPTIAPPSPTPTPIVTPTPTIPPNPNGCVGVQSISRRSAAATNFVGVHPIANGDSYAYSGSLKQTIVRSSPCPMPTAVSNATVTLVVSVQTPLPSQPPSTLNEHSAETDAFQTNTQTVTTDAVVQSVTSGSDTFFQELSEMATDQAGNAVATTYAASAPLQYAHLPENGTGWTNKPPATVNQSLTDGSTYNRSYAAVGDGSYTETDTVVGTTNTIAVNSNGSGTYTIGANTTAPITVTAAAPSGGNIGLTLTGLSSTPVSRTVKAWFPAGSLVTDATQDNGSKPIDPSCGSLSPVGSPALAEQFVRTISTSDPVLGYTDTRTVTTWDIAAAPSGKVTGPICAVITDVQKIFYDYTFVTPYFVALSYNAVPLQVTTIDETVFLNAAPVNNAVKAGASAMSAQLNAHLAGVNFARAVQRAQRIDALVRASHAARLGGVR